MRFLGQNRAKTATTPVATSSRPAPRSRSTPPQRSRPPVAIPLQSQQQRSRSGNSALLSNRTGGFTLPSIRQRQPAAAPVHDDAATLLSTSIYIDRDHDSVCPSEATTVKAGSSPMNVEDIELKLDMFKYRVRNGLGTTLAPLHETHEFTPTGGRDNQTSRSRPTQRASKNSPKKMPLEENGFFPNRRSRSLSVEKSGAATQPKRTTSPPLPTSPDGKDYNKGWRNTTSRQKSPRHISPDSTFRASTDDEDGFSICSDFDSGNRANMTDESLMFHSKSPGALRLTEDGLKRHEKKSFQQLVKAKPRDEFEAWALQKQKQAWFKEKFKQRAEEKLEEKTLLRRARTEPPLKTTASEFKPSNHTNKSADATKRSVATKLFPSSVKQDLVVEKKSNGGIFAMFRRHFDPSIAARELLERERLAAIEAERKAKLVEMLEKERIERKKREYLNLQRSRELCCREGYPSIFRTETDTSSKNDVSTISSAKSALPPCVVCCSGERTHIATPCMHFSFCGTCVPLLECSPVSKCPVCKVKDVKYASVVV